MERTMKKAITVLFIIILPIVSFGQGGATTSHEWADSTLLVLRENRSNSILFSAENLSKLEEQFKMSGELCKELEVKLLSGSNCHDEGNFEEALKTKFQFDSLFNPDCDSNLVISSLLLEANVYMTNKSLADAETIAKKSLSLYNPVWGQPEKLYSIYNFLGSIQFVKEDFKNAIKYYNKSLVVIENNGLKAQNEVVILFNKAISNYYLGQNDSTSYFIGLCLETAKENKNIMMQCRAYNTLAAFSKDPERQLLYIDSAIALAIENHMLVDLVDFHENKSTAFEKTGAFKDAYNTLWTAARYRDTLYKEQTAKAVAQLNAKFKLAQQDLAISELEINQKESELESTKLKSSRTKLIYGSIFLLGVLVVISFRFFETKKTKDLLRSKNILITEEKQKSENLLLNILPFDVAQELKEKGKADARDFEMISILFTDFKGFTEQSAKLSAQDLVSEINICFEAFDGIIDKFQVEKIKTIGDAYMAAGGLPIPTDDSVKNTVLAALEMQTFINNRKAEMIVMGKPAFEMRLGIHTGPVVAGIVGVKKFQYDIWGDTVNTASRMESSGEVGKVNISQDTYELLKNDGQFNFESRGKIEAKGKGEIEMYFVTVK